jgi:hypothetical protein
VRLLRLLRHLAVDQQIQRHLAVGIGHSADAIQAIMSNESTLIDGT